MVGRGRLDLASRYASILQLLTLLCDSNVLSKIPMSRTDVVFVEREQRDSADARGGPLMGGLTLSLVPRWHHPGLFVWSRPKY